MGSVDRGTKGTLEFLVGLACSIFVVGSALILLATHYMTSEMRLKNELFTQLKAKERAEAVVEASRLFLANLSHDLRTPMAGIIGLLEILIANGLDVEQSGVVSNIMSMANTLHSLLNSILDISRVEKGQLSLDLVPFSLRETLEENVDLFCVETMNKGIEIVLELPDELPDRLMGDPMRVRQVFSNLLSNCVKFTETGHVIIRGTLIRRVHGEQALRLRPLSSSARKRSSSTSSSKRNSFSSKESTPRGSVNEGSNFSTASKHKLAILFEVSDTGKEVPVKQREGIFEKFVQLPDKHSRYGGSGFALGIVRSLVQLMGGSISIVDNGVPGCTFSFSLVFSEVEPPMVSPEDTTTAEQVPLPLSLPLVNGAGVHVLLAIPESIGKALASKWLFNHKANVWQVDTLVETVNATKNMWKQLVCPGEVQQTPLLNMRWGALSGKKFSFQCSADTEGGGPNRQVPDILTAPAYDAAQSRPKGGIVLLDIHLVPKPVKEFFEKGGGFLPLLEALRTVKEEHSLNLPMVVVWLVVASTPADIQRTMKSNGCIVVQKPLYATRLASILCRVAPNPMLAVPPLRSKSILIAAKEPTPPSG